MAFVLLIPVSIYAQSQYDIPAWVKGVAGFWADEKITDSEFGEGLSFLIDSGIIKVPKIQELENDIRNLQTQNNNLLDNISVLENENNQLKLQIKSEGTKNSISIVGDISCKTKTEQALELLKDKANTVFRFVTTHIGIIECVEQGSGMKVSEIPPRFIAGKATVDAGTIWYAGTISHDSYHSYQYSNYLKNNPQENYVPSDIYIGGNAEAESLAFQYDALVLLGASQSTLDYVKDIIESKYWEIPYEDRWW